MSNPNVREITAAEQHRYNQIGVHKLAREAFWHSFDACLAPLVEKCEDLAHHYVPNLWDQYKEGLITASKFLNKLVDEMIQTDGKPMSPIDQAAAQEILSRANGACRKFARISAKPIGDQLANEAVQIKDCTWRLTWTIDAGAFHFCHMIGSRLSDLDRESKLA